jgi:hypothetical protein
MSGQVISSSLWFGVFICLGLWVLGLLAGTTLVPFHIVVVVTGLALLSGCRE